MGPGARFGCLFALIFLAIAGSLVAASAFILSQLGPVPGIIAAVVVIGVLVDCRTGVPRHGHDAR